MWRVFFIATGRRTETVVPVNFLTAADEHAARGYAMRFHRAGVKWIVVRPPHGAAMISGAALESWLIEVPFGRVSV